MLPTPLLIAKKRDGKVLSDPEIEQFVQGVVKKEVSGEQTGAMLMAIFLKGMTVQETISLTRSMRFSGEQLNWPQYKGSVVDKHSTGGVGDKISIPLAPALAACGVKVPMISGRGLGHTGGTLDKLEAIPGYNVLQSFETMATILENVGCFIVGQSPTLVPADRIIYGVRDVTGTVESIPLITASIISKKASAGLNALLLDVKVGRAAFMKTEENARALAQSLVDSGNGNGMKTSALLTRMDQPIGNMIGNSLEIVESIDCMKGKGPDDLRELVCVQGGHLLLINGKVETKEEGYNKILQTLTDGTALTKFREMMVAQGVSQETATGLCGDDSYSVLGKAQSLTPILADKDGFVSDIDAMALALVASRHGAGRQKVGDIIDFVVGIELTRHMTNAVKKGDTLAIFHHTKPIEVQDSDEIRNAFVISETQPALLPYVIGSIGF